MSRHASLWRRLLPALVLAAAVVGGGRAPGAEERRLYVAVPGVRNYLEYGGHGLLVFDIDHGHKFLKRIPTAGVNAEGKPDNVKGVCASAITGRLYISTIQTLTCLDLLSEKVLWERAYDGGCDRMSISPDGKVIYLPSFEKDHWHVVDALKGDVIARIVPRSGAHNTVYGLDGKHAYLAGLRSPLLTVADTSVHRAEKTVGPFSASIRPFTVNGRQSHCFVNVNELLGFEVGDIAAGKKLHRVEVSGFKTGPVKRHGCPSHGIGMTPDEKEIWVVDAYNERVHIFDATVMPPKQLESIKVRDEPGWVTFTRDGRYAYPSTGDVIEAATRKIVAGLTDEHGTAVQSEKMLEIDFADGRPVRTGDQFGLGRVLPAMTSARPFRSQLLKWVGNKQRFAHEIIAHFPADYGTYYEPFLGSGGVLATLAPRRAVGSDVFGPLLEIWSALHDSPETLSRWYAERLRAAEGGGKIARYEAVRASYNARPNGADLLFLCRSCYGGVVRFRKADGLMSTPCGPHTPISAESFARRVGEWSRRTRGTRFVQADFEAVMTLARPGDLVYCDPPYSDTQPILYGAQSFSLARLFRAIGECKARGVRVALSLDGSKRSGARVCHVPVPEGLFARDVLVDCGRSMLRRFQMAGRTLEREVVADRLLLTY